MKKPTKNPLPLLQPTETKSVLGGDLNGSVTPNKNILWAI